MKMKIVALTMIAVFLTSVLFAVTPAVSATTASPNLEPIYDMPSLDDEAYMEKYGSMTPATGNPWTVMVSDDYLGGEYPQNFELFGEGDYCRMWIGLNDTYGDYKDVNGNYHFFYGYPRTPEDIITPQNLTYLINHFDIQIYPTNTGFFGMPLPRPPEDPNGFKINMLIFNIRDWAFYDSAADWYIAGYFSAAISSMNNANIIHIDTNRWDLRLGPPPRPRPWVVESTVAHEFEHLIHNDIDSDEFSWIDEGCAMYSELLNGYGHPATHIRYYIVYHHWTSLTVWTGGLENYGAVYLFMLYLSEHYGGGPTIQALVREQANGIAGVNNLLEDLGYTKRFDEIFQDWAIANYLDDTTFAGGIYGYYTLNIPSADTLGWDIPYAVKLLTRLKYFKGEIGEYPYSGGDAFAPYTAHYVHFKEAKPSLKVDFNGDDFAGILPYSGSYEWHSDLGNWLWNRLHQTFTIPATGATLKFWTNYQIEQDWDYGYVEVHDLTTDTWTTLPGLRTTTTLPYQQDNPNVPAGSEPMDYYAAGKWNGLTGFAGAWYQEVMDLSAFAGHTIELYFTYWTDGAAMEAGFYIDNIEIPEIPFFDDVEVGANGWTTNGWYRTNGLIDNNFEVNFFQTVKYESIHGEMKITNIMPMTIDDTTEEGSITISMPHFKKVEYEPVVMLVANQPGWDSVLSTGYTFTATELKK